MKLVGGDEGVTLVRYILTPEGAFATERTRHAFVMLWGRRI